MRPKSASIEEIQAWLLDSYGPPSDEAKAMIEAYKVEREMRLAVGSELLQARKNAGITQAKLAVQLGESNSTTLLDKYIKLFPKTANAKEASKLRIFSQVVLCGVDCIF